MAKKKTFEAILETEFRWPMQGDLPFVPSGDPAHNANINASGLLRLYLMINGYKTAADLMVLASSDDPSKRDSLVFPIIFNYRQFLELSLKSQLASFGATVGIDPVWDTHDLGYLWADFCDMLHRYGTTDPDEVDPIVGQIVLEFAKIDPRSYSYRYPVDRKGNPVPIEYTDLYLPRLADVMNGVAGYFSGCDGYLSDLQQAGP